RRVARGDPRAVERGAGAPRGRVPPGGARPRRGRPPGAAAAAGSAPADPRRRGEPGDRGALRRPRPARAGRPGGPVPQGRPGRRDLAEHRRRARPRPGRRRAGGRPVGVRGAHRRAGPRGPGAVRVLLRPVPHLQRAQRTGGPPHRRGRRGLRVLAEPLPQGRLGRVRLPLGAAGGDRRSRARGRPDRHAPRDGLRPPALRLRQHPADAGRGDEEGPRVLRGRGHAGLPVTGAPPLPHPLPAPGGSMTVHRLTLGDVLREHRRSRPTGTAAVDGPLRLSYTELDDRVNRLANALAAAGVGRGDRVCYIGRNSVRLQEGLLAAGRLGAVFVPANWRQSADELAFVLSDLAPAAVLWQSEGIGEAVRAARGAAPEAAEARWVHCATAARETGADEYEGFLAAAPAEDPDGDGDGSLPVLGLYTAAFDGRPSCALLSSDALLAHSATLLWLRRIEPGFTFLNSGPLFHVGTVMFNLAALHAGGTNVYLPAFDAAEAARLIEAERVDHIFGFGPMLDAIAEAAGGHDLSSLHFTAHSPEWDARITVGTDPWNASGMGGYGQTEVGGMLTFLALGMGGAGGA